MKANKMNFLKFARKAMQGTIAAGLASVGLLSTEALFSPVHAAQQIFCSGQMNNGWSYTAEFLDGRFTQIRWERAGQPPQVSPLTFLSSNVQGQPIYRGSLLAAVSVTLVDLSGGDVRAGSQISVGVEEWGWSRGTCGSTASTERTGPNTPIAVVQQNLLGVESNQAREWLRQNDFFFISTVEHTETRVVEQWNRDTQRSINVIIVDDMIFDVVEGQ